MIIHSYKDLTVWKRAMELVKANFIKFVELINKKPWEKVPKKLRESEFVYISSKTISETLNKKSL